MNENRRRRSSAGGYARGEETRRRIIDAAIALFGQHGYEGASTRDIAAYAGVNAPALQYYFENKEGVYRACAESLADESWQALEPAVTRAKAVLATDAEPAVLIDAFIGILEAVADRTFIKRCQPDQRLFFAREQGGGEPDIASEILTRRVRRPLNDVGVELLERITGVSATDPVTIVRMFSLHGQLLLFYIAQRSTTTMLNWTDIDVEKAEFLKANMRAQSRVLLEHWNREREARNAALGAAVTAKAAVNGHGAVAKPAKRATNTKVNTPATVKATAKAKTGTRAASAAKAAKSPAAATARRAAGKRHA